MKLTGGLKDLKKLFLLSSLVVLSLQATDGETFLSNEKLQNLELQEQKAQYEADYLQKSWLSPVMLTYSESENDYNDITTRTKRISIDQPIFKSGGIIYAIKYANAVRDSSLKQVEATKRELISQAVELLFNYNKTKKQIQKQELLLENNYIDIKRKKEQYSVGLIDSSELDRALLEKNQNAITLLGLRESLSQIEQNFQKISDLKIEDATPPKLELVDKSDFVEYNIDYLVQKSSVQSKDYQTIMTLSQYLPQLSVNAQYSEMNTRAGTAANPIEQEQYGFAITMPLSFNSYDDVQRKRYDFLKSRSDLQDTKRALEKDYVKLIKQLEFVEKKINLSQEDAKTYENLVSQTKDQVYVGTLTKYDLETMQNSLKIKELDKSIYEIDKNILLLELYIKTYQG